MKVSTELEVFEDCEQCDLESRIIAEAARQATEGLRSDLRNAIKDIAENAIGDIFRDELHKLASEGFQRTGPYGHPQGEPKSLKAIIAEILARQQDRGYGQRGPTIELLAKEVIEVAMRKEFAEVIADARKRFKALVDEQLLGKISEELRRAVGMK